MADIPLFGGGVENQTGGILYGRICARLVDPSPMKDVLGRRARILLDGNTDTGGMCFIYEFAKETKSNYGIALWL